jgi:hypothetical protein
LIACISSPVVPLSRFEAIKLATQFGCGGPVGKRPTRTRDEISAKTTCEGTCVVGTSCSLGREDAGPIAQEAVSHARGFVDREWRPGAAAPTQLLVRRVATQRCGAVHSTESAAEDCQWWSCPITRITEAQRQLDGLDRKQLCDCNSIDQKLDVASNVDYEQRSSWNEFVCRSIKRG